MQAFARFASPQGRSFTFVERIPRERGLGSSASAVALGLVAGALAAGVEPTADELLEAGLDARGPPRQPRRRARRRRLPHVGRAHRPRRRRSSGRRRSQSFPRPASSRRMRVGCCRRRFPHEDAVFSAARAALLGAALAAGTPALFAASAADRLHEPYRADDAPCARRDSRRSAGRRARRRALRLGADRARLGGTRPRSRCRARARARASRTHDVRRLSVTSSGAGPA